MEITISGVKKLRGEEVTWLGGESTSGRGFRKWKQKTCDRIVTENRL